MKRIGRVFFAGLFGLLLVGADDAQPALHFPAHGYSIAPLEGARDAGRGVLLEMFLPASGDFAPNVNVLTEDSSGTIDDYIAQSKQQMDGAGWKIIKADKIDGNTALFEYAGSMKDKPLHWYAKASLKGNEIILVTATATEDQWPNVATQMEACVDSFQRDADK